MSKSSNTFLAHCSIVTSVIQISVTTQDGNPLADDASRNLFLTITYNFPYDPQKTTKPTVEKKTVQLDSDGTYTLTVTPAANSQSLQLQVHIPRVYLRICVIFIPNASLLLFPAIF